MIVNKQSQGISFQKESRAHFSSSQRFSNKLTQEKKKHASAQDSD